ncbi:MAG: UDP-N-acetylglucosamine 2-epimerase (non-hydrolyzing) [Actinobacteria bacterium]|nr:MAG: UDP-N-acetylglucosamine 2-epimerase (non-hydrolyzing) [Actinomycetota bacterium]
MTVLSVIGTRPEAIKMAPVVAELSRRPDEVRSLVCLTGQHEEMLDQALELFDVPRDFDLDVMRPDQSLAELTANLLRALTPVVAETKPDWIVAQGDTTTVLVAALAALYERVPFAHVEAGLRTGDLAKPFPEEANRCVADRLSALHFAPTERSRQALLSEGCAAGKIFVTGNTVIDALRLILEKPCDWSSGPLNTLSPDERIVLITAHRRESFGAPLRQMCEAIRALATRFGDVRFVYPVHLNPNVRAPVFELLSGLGNVLLLDPVDYLSLANLMSRSTLILTDSGGIQEEAPSLGVPVLVMREVTERPEGVEAGAVKLVGTGRDRIIAEASRLLTDDQAGTEMSRRANPYGDGRAAVRIVDALVHGRPKDEFQPGRDRP